MLPQLALLVAFAGPAAGGAARAAGPATATAVLHSLRHSFACSVGPLALQAELDLLLKEYVGRPTPLYHADRLSEYYRRWVQLGEGSARSAPACRCQLLCCEPLQGLSEGG